MRTVKPEKYRLAIAISLFRKLTRGRKQIGKSTTFSLYNTVKFDLRKVELAILKGLEESDIEIDKENEQAKPE